MDDDDQIGLPATLIAFILGATFWCLATIGLFELLGLREQNCVPYQEEFLP